MVFVLLVIFIITTPQLMTVWKSICRRAVRTAATQNKPMPARILVLGRNRVLLEHFQNINHGLIVRVVSALNDRRYSRENGLASCQFGPEFGQT